MTHCYFQTSNNIVKISLSHYFHRNSSTSLSPEMSVTGFYVIPSSTEQLVYYYLLIEQESNFLKLIKWEREPEDKYLGDVN